MFVVKNSKLFLILGLIIFITADVVAMRPLGSQKGVSIDRQKAMIGTLKYEGINLLTGEKYSRPKGSKAKKDALEERLKDKGIDLLTACKQDELFIQEKAGSLWGICVSSDIIELSTTLSNKRKYAQQYSQGNKVIFDFPFDIMKDTFDILKIYNKGGTSIKEKIKGYPLNELIRIANFIDFLDGPKDVLNDILHAISNYIKDGNFREVLDLKVDLNYHLVDAVFTDFSIQYLKDIIANNRKIYLPFTGSSYSAAFSPDSKRIVTTSLWNRENNLIIWDISNIHKITQYKSTQSSMMFNQAVFSPDGKKIISSSSDDLANPGTRNILSIWDARDESNIIKVDIGFSIIALSSDGKKVISTNKNDEFIVSDITDMNNITHQEFPKVDPGRIEMAVFSSDGKKIVFVSRNNGLRSASVYDISNMNEIKHGKLIENDPDSEFVVAFSPDGERIVSGSNGTEKMQHSLIVWDISDINNIMDKVFAEDTETLGFSAIAFSPDGKKIVSGGMFRDYLVVWNVSDMQNITHQVVPFLTKTAIIDLVAFSPDGKTILAKQAFSNEISILMPLSGEEEAVLNQLKECDFIQKSLVYKLCSKSGSGSIKALQPNSPEDDVFRSLPSAMQQLLSDILWLNWPIFISPKEEQQSLPKEEQQATGWLSGFRN